MAVIKSSFSPNHPLLFMFFMYIPDVWKACTLTRKKFLIVLTSPLLLIASVIWLVFLICYGVFLLCALAQSDEFLIVTLLFYFPSRIFIVAYFPALILGGLAMLFAAPCSAIARSGIDDPVECDEVDSSRWLHQDDDRL